MFNLPASSERISDVWSVLIGNQGEDFQRSRQKRNLEFTQGKASLLYKQVKFTSNLREVKNI